MGKTDTTMSEEKKQRLKHQKKKKIIMRQKSLNMIMNKIVF